MTLRKTLLLLAATIGLLLPAGQLIRPHNPWTCFPMTWDESFFAQASLNWGEGRGYRMNWDAKPFSPAITVGIPMAWGSNIIHGWSGEDIARSGRIFVYFTFILAGLVLLRSALVKERNWIAVPIALWFFGYGVSKLPMGDFFVFGYLGEGPGLMFGAFAYHAIVRRRFFLAGVLGVATFAMKPTFVFLAPAILLACLFRSHRAAFFAGRGSALAGVSYVFAIAKARDQGVFEYLNELSHFGSLVSAGIPLTKFFTDAGPVPTVLGVAFLVSGVISLIRFKKYPKVEAGHVAFFFFVLNIAKVLLSGDGVVVRHWSALCCMTLLGFSIDWSNAIARRLSGAVSEKNVREIFLAVTITWALAIGLDAKHRYKRMPDYGCPGKEQSAINAELRRLNRMNEVNTKNLVLLSHDHPFSNWIYGLGWDPTSIENWTTVPKPTPKWVAGQINSKDVLPPECQPHIRGEQFSLYRCAEEPKAPVSRPHR